MSLPFAVPGFYALLMSSRRDKGIFKWFIVKGQRSVISIKQKSMFSSEQKTMKTRTYRKVRVNSVSKSHETIRTIKDYKEI